MSDNLSKMDVRVIQRNLKEQGFYAGKIDGMYGPQTEKAVSDYLASNNMPASAASSVGNDLRSTYVPSSANGPQQPFSDDTAAKQAVAADGAGVKAKKKFSKDKFSAKKKCPSVPKCPEPGKLGALSAKYESGSRGSAAIGYDNTGGWSYGKYQIETKRGTMKSFLKNIETSSPTFSKQLQDAGGYSSALAGDDKFKDAWKKAAEDPDFEDLQHDYIASKNYSPLVDKVKTDTGLDIGQRSAAVKDAAWSVAVQHGPGSTVISTALKDKDVAKMSDAEIIDAIYDERSAKVTNKDGEPVLKYFQKSTQNVQDGVSSRFAQEQKCAKYMLEVENQSKAQTK